MVRLLSSGVPGDSDGAIYACSFAAGLGQPVLDGERKTPRKRKRAAYKPNERENDAEKRHLAVEPDLQAALAGFKIWLENSCCSSLTKALIHLSKKPELACNTPGQADSASLQTHSGKANLFLGHARAEETSCAPAKDESPGAQGMRQIPDPDPGAGLEGNCLEAPLLDTLALAELQHIVKPKFECMDSQSNLLNCLISNKTDMDQEGIAHDTQVVLPANCCFLIADIARFKILLRGKLFRRLLTASKVIQS